ncbi:MAG: AsmA family protein [Alphaproteobacteria bacterium]
MARLFAALTLIIVAAIAAALIVPRFVNWNDYRHVFEAEASKVFGRSVRIEGDVNLVVLPTPAISMRGVRVADEYGRFERPFAEVERFSMVLSLRALIGGTVEAKKLELDQPVLRLTLDGLGEGNWQSVRPYGFNLPIRQVILSQAEISNGAIEFRRDRRRRALRIDRISGTLNADSLQGPFRFTGEAYVGREMRKLRLSADAQGKSDLRLKGTIRSANGVSLYQVDGNLKGLYGPLKYTGPIVARVALDKAAREASGSLAELTPGTALELRASSVISLEDVKLENIAFTLTQDNRPQSLSGSAFASWGGKPRLDIAVESKRFDIDQLLRFNGHKTARPTPASAIAALPKIFEGWPFTPKQGAIIAKFGQATLGGDVIEELDLSVFHDSGAWKIEKLTGRLPGNTDIDIKGKVPAGDAFALSGDIKLSGRNLSRLLRWAAPSLGAVDAGNAPRFSLASKVALSVQRVALLNAKGELGDSTFSGDLVYDYGDSSKLVVALESKRLDLRNVFGDSDLASTAFGGGGKKPAPAPAPEAASETLDDPGAPKAPETASKAPDVPAKSSLADVAKTIFHANSTQMRVKVAQLLLPTMEARDVRSSLRYQNGTLDIRELNLATTDGLSIKANGRVTGFEKIPNGAINLSVDAPTAPSVLNLARLLGLESAGRISPTTQKRMDAFAPLRISGQLNASKRNRTFELKLKGKAAGSELSLAGRLDGELTDLDTASLDISGAIGNTDGRRLIAQLAPDVPQDAKAPARGAGALDITVSGALKNGLKGRIDLRTPEAEGRFKGSIMPLAEPWAFDGDLTIKAKQAATVLSMLRLSPGGTPVTGNIDLHTAIVKKGMRYDISSLDLRIGGETIGGKASIDVSGERPVADIDIGAQNIILPKLAAYLVDWGRKDISSQLAEATSGKSVWPSQAFSFNAFESADGKLKMKADTMLLIDGMTISQAKLQATLKNGALTISRLDGELYDGEFAGSGSLKSANGRIALDGRVKLEDINIAKLTTAKGGRPLLKSKGGLELSFSGEGFSPRGLVTIATGKGKFNLQKGTLRGLSPAAIKNAADSYPEGKAANKKKRWSEQLIAKLRKGKLTTPEVSAPITLQNGLLQVQNLKAQGKYYKTEIDAMLDLSALRLDSEWKVRTRGKSKFDENLPPVLLVFAGPAANFTKLQPRIDHGELERFLSFKGAERKMERLEKLNQQIPDGDVPPTPSRRNGARPAPAPSTSALSPAQHDTQAPDSQPVPRRSSPQRTASPPPAPAPQPQSPLTDMPEPDTSPPSDPSSASSAGAGNSGNVRLPPESDLSFPGWATETEEQTPAPSATARAQQSETSEDFKARIRRALRSSTNSGSGPVVRHPPDEETGVPQN